ncbi:MAG: aldo/keto reductase [Cyclobacteriaceae bacterium]|nr:aldo/keto reductase [Cyclobacteriaceae bacterium]
MENRREFLKYLAGLTAGLLVPGIPGQGQAPLRDRLGEILPTRLLGRTGKQVTMLGTGGYHVGWTNEKDAQEVIEASLEGGIRFFDNAESYGPHTAETRYGKYLTPKYRDLIFLMTKTTARDVKTAKEHLEGSLKRMKVDHVDLWQVHSLQSPDDTDKRKENGILDLFREMKEQGKVKHIGFTGHADPNAHVRMLAATQGEDLFETIQMPINVVDVSYKESFIKKVFNAAVDRDLGMLAMKTLADGRFFSNKIMNGNEVWKSDDPVVGRISMKEALYFVWSLPVSVLITGAENAPLIKEKIALAKSFSALDDGQRNALIEKVADLAVDKKVEYYKNV